MKALLHMHQMSNLIQVKVGLKLNMVNKALDCAKHVLNHMLMLRPTLLEPIENLSLSQQKPSLCTPMDIIKYLERAW